MFVKYTSLLAHLSAQTLYKKTVMYTKACYFCEEHMLSSENQRSHGLKRTLAANR